MPDAERLSLLVADDEELIRRRVALMLGDRFRLDEAATAKSALKAATGGYDAILLDIVFPDGNGIDICKEIKEQRPHATVVISSSLESVDAWNRAFQAGADGYLEKRELLEMDPRKTALMIENLVERNRLRELAEETNQRQAELLSVLSHDVRAPFQALLGTIELLRGSRIPPETADKVETLHRCARDQLSFINSLLELLRLESSTTCLRVFQVDVNLVVNQCVQGLRVLADRKEISLAVDLAGDLPRVEGDMARIAQVMNNLLNNAIKFTMRRGRIAVCTQMLERGDLPGVEIRVQDTGVGVRPEDRFSVFQRFRKARDRGTEGETGTGLGLSICRQIMQLHGGAITLEPAEPGGTLVAAWFPVRLPRCADRCDERSPVEDPAPEVPQCAVLR